DDEIRAKAAPLRRGAVALFAGGIVFVVATVVLFLMFFVSAGSEIANMSYTPGLAENVPFFIFFILLVPGVILLVLGGVCQSKMRNIICESLVLEALLEGFTDVSYDPKASIDKALIKSVKLVDNWQQFKGKDHFLGLYKGRKVEFSDLTLSHEVSSGESSHTVIDFKGPWMICDFGKHIPTRLKIRERKGGNAVSGKKSSVETENIAFNKQFQILTDDPHSAFYILTPHFMERIVRMDTAAHGQTLLCFEGSRVHIAINSGRELFKVTGRKKELEDFSGLRASFRQELFYITGIIDILCENDNLVR
ncbi:MAG: DUF3137 domain-containing protein, partial [Oscillospiraceae bacterium]|nr:DUF3137 domain-containing protein [Oscillospiraceae bacterium]